MKIRYEYTQIQCVDVAKEGNIKRVPGLTLGYPDVICRKYFKQFGIGHGFHCRMRVGVNLAKIEKTF